MERRSTVFSTYIDRIIGEELEEETPPEVTLDMPSVNDNDEELERKEWLKRKKLFEEDSEGTLREDRLGSKKQAKKS